MHLLSDHIELLAFARFAWRVLVLQLALTGTGLQCVHHGGPSEPILDGPITAHAISSAAYRLGVPMRDPMQDELAAEVREVE